MSKFLLKRLIMMLLTMLCASFLVFAVCEFTPGSVARKSLGPFATQQQVDLLTEKLKANDPLLVRYGRWLGVLVGAIPDPLQDPSTGLNFKDPRGAQYFGNFGYSLMLRAPVRDVIAEPLRNTVLLCAVALAFIVPLSLGIGILAGTNRGTRLDRWLSLGCLVVTSLPEYATGVVLMTIFVSVLGWLPGTSPLLTSEQWSVASQMVLPTMVLVLASASYIARIVRASMAETMLKPFVRTAMLKGLSRRRQLPK